MKSYTYQLVPDNSGNPSVHVYVDGGITLVQPFDHRTPGTEPFKSESSATEWAETWIAEAKRTDLISLSIEAQSEADAALDRAYKQAVILQALGSTS
jgi:hypothetical protein